ncbi:MAG: elongation factor P [bacterium]|nr:elongation factor P [bacterium]
MLGYFDLRKGVRFIYEGEPYEVLDFNQMKKAQREGIAQVKMRSLISGKVTERGFHSADKFEEADLQKLQVKYLYNHPDRKSATSNGASRNRYFFCEADNVSKRFDLSEEQVGAGVKFLKPNSIVETLSFEDKIITVSLPIKVQLKVTEAPPGVQGDRAQGGLKTIVLETGAQINAPLFIEEGELIEVNTETGEYVKRAE